jgi:hypothetical protein
MLFNDLVTLLILITVHPYWINLTERNEKRMSSEKCESDKMFRNTVLFEPDSIQFRFVRRSFPVLNFCILITVAAVLARAMLCNDYYFQYVFNFIVVNLFLP